MYNEDEVGREASYHWELVCLCDRGFFEIEMFIEITSSAEWQKGTSVDTQYIYDLVQLLVMFRFHLAASAASSCCLLASSWAARNRSFASAISFAASSFPPAQPDNRIYPNDLHPLSN
jgi:hypothetical protein